MPNNELARVIRLLDEAKDEIRASDLKGLQQGAHIVSKITEAQNILIGAKPTDARDN